MSSVTADPVAAGTFPAPTTGLAAPVVNASGAGIPVKRSETIIKNTMVTIKTTEGFLYNGVDAANHVFAGVAAETVTGDAAADTTPAKRKTKGRFWFSLTGGGATDLGKEALLVDNAAVQVAATTASIKAGRIIAMDSYTSPTKALIQIDGYC